MSENRTLSTLIKAPIDEAIPPTDLDEAFANPPFVSVHGTFNLRDLTYHNNIRPNLVFRSGTLFRLTPDGKDQLIDNLKVRTIFDLRSAGELKAFPFPDLTSETGSIEVIWCPADATPSILDINDYVDLASDAVDSWDGGARGFSIQYLEILHLYETGFRQVFQHLLDRPGEALLFNCTAGKDRTGTLAALILSLAGVPDEDIAFDYALSRIGIEQQKEFLTAFIKKWKPEWTPETPGMRGFSNVRSEYMIRFLQDAKAAYPGADGWAAQYTESVLGFSKSDIDKIRANLRACCRGFRHGNEPGS